ncbi:uncharacterized protein SPSK_05636 [Sporothrix schenckii 1099-18]|uniref:Uncharacterized protein n=1 Tax=Sporothrix schenckii 1099-18 TaxID=1397361 RepID=A0A0F2LUM1_SPOSC|nr:uncharacterized protein SPSK_05636 [Sporothrix schenckii 1099-18]KJR80539.1 hypothetical protein SPSK_05636 [Sporothrix schenckii 1099-18]
MSVVLPDTPLRMKQAEQTTTNRVDGIAGDGKGDQRQFPGRTTLLGPGQALRAFQHNHRRGDRPPWSTKVLISGGLGSVTAGATNGDDNMEAKAWGMGGKPNLWPTLVSVQRHIGAVQRSDLSGRRGKKDVSEEKKEKNGSKHEAAKVT